MRILTFSTLFPNAAKPHHGIFTETTLRHQLATGELSSKVVAPVPWFPSSHPRFGEYATFAKVPFKENRIGVDVYHPRYPVVPKVGASIAPLSLALCARPTIGRLLDENFDFDVIDAHYFYPDGVAAVMLGKYFNKPIVVSALGTDINLIIQKRFARRMIRWTGKNAASMITVCDALRNEMIRYGMQGAKINTLRNGVDLSLFSPPENREALRDSLGFDGYTLLSVGHLDPRKGHVHAIRALSDLPDVKLVVVGGGPELRRLMAAADESGVADRVTFQPPLPQDRLRQYYGAADALVLASSREGWANVLLEAMACGTPVVASDVWGTPEVVRVPEAGVLMPSVCFRGVVEGVRRLRASQPDRAATRLYAEQFSWAETTRGQIDLFKAATRKTARRSAEACC